MEGFEERTVDRQDRRQLAALVEFQAGFGLAYRAGEVDYTMAVYRADQLVATGSLAGEVLRNIAVAPAVQSRGLTAVVLTHLLRVAARRGIYHYFIYTRPDSAPLFASLGFHEIGQALPEAVLLEGGVGSIQDECRRLTGRVNDLPAGGRAGLVMTANPFTLGHRMLVRQALTEVGAAVILVVSEEKTVFPFAVRYRLITAGLAPLKNILVLPAGKYVVSTATFPGYFTPGGDTVPVQTRLDADVFARHIAPALGLTVRYAGEEPYCPVTSSYNEALAAILPARGVIFKEIPRLRIDGEPVSASRVRQLLRTGDLAGAARLVPETTLAYLRSPAAGPVLEKLRTNRSRH